MNTTIVEIDSYIKNKGDFTMKVKVKVIPKSTNPQVCPICGSRIRQLPRTAILIQREIILVPTIQVAA